MPWKPESCRCPTPLRRPAVRRRPGVRPRGRRAHRRRAARRRGWRPRRRPCGTRRGGASRRRGARAAHRPARPPGCRDVDGHGRRPARVREADGPDDGRQRAGGAGGGGRPARQLRGRRRPAAAHARAVPGRPWRAPEVRQRAVRRDQAGLRHRPDRASCSARTSTATARSSRCSWTRRGSARRCTSSARRSARASAACTSGSPPSRRPDRARADERSRSAAKGGDFEDLLEGMLGDLARWRRGPAGPHRDRDRARSSAPRRATSSSPSTRG